jgi:hypothetical protein
MLSPQTLDLGKRAATGLLGVDALFRSEGGDGLVVVNMDTQGELVPEPFDSYAAARGWFEELRREAGGLPEADRRVYYDELCHSTLAFIQWRDGGLDFSSQLGSFLHVPVEPAPDVELDQLCESIRELLNGMGYAGDLKAQCEAWEERNRVQPDEVQTVLEELLSQAWDRTETALLKIPAPKSDGMRAETVSGVAFNARCNYMERAIELNTDPTLTRPGLKHLAVHEGYPGHYLQFKLRETAYREGMAPADGLLSIVNSASSSVFEGIADTGLRMLGWIDSDDDRVLALLNRHRAGLGTQAAWRLHALEQPEEQVTDWLRAQSLVGGEGWVANRMGFITAPSRAVLIWSYWWGERVVAPAWERVAQARRPEFLHFLYGRMHSNRSVEMFH